MMKHYIHETYVTSSALAVDEDDAVELDPALSSFP